MRYSIEPTQRTIPGEGTVTLTSIFMTINYDEGMVTMTVPYNLCDAETRSWISEPAFISQAELDQWDKEDDMYIVNLVVAQAGVTLAE